MESQPQNPEFRINPENFHPCISVTYRSLKTNSKEYVICLFFIYLYDFSIRWKSYFQRTKRVLW